MIADKTSVCTQRNGGCVEVQNLSVSDLVYDHVSGLSDEIVRILKKTVSLNNGELSAYFPISLSVNQVMVWNTYIDNSSFSSATDTHA